MAFSSPEVVSLRGDAEMVRHVYLSGLTESYSVWSARLDAHGYYLVTRPSDPVDYNNQDHSDRVITGPVPSIDAMAVKETATADVAAIVYEVRGSLWAVEYNYATQLVTSGPTLLYDGSDPSVALDVSDLMVSYLRDGALKTRRGLLGTELEIVKPSSTDIIDQDTNEKIGVPTVLRYAGLVGQNADVARRFAADVNSEALYDSGLATQIPGAPVPYEEVEEGTDGTIGDNVLISQPSAVGGGQSYVFNEPAAEQERWGLRFGPYIGVTSPIPLGDQWSLHFWMITPQTNYATVFLRATASDGSYINIHLPWSDGNLYFDVYDNLGGLDRINKALGAVPGMEHWVFTQNSVTGVRKIFRDGVEWHSGTSLFNALPDIANLWIGQDGNKVYGWDGELAEFAIFGYDLDLTQAQELNTGLPGYLQGDEPGLIRYWKFDDSAIVTALKDLSGNGKHLELGLQDYSVDGIEFRNYYPSLDTLPAAAGVTIEAWVQPQFHTEESLFPTCDEIAFGVKNDGRVFFTIDQPASLYTNTSGTITGMNDGGGGTSVLVTCSAAHGLTTGAVVAIKGSNGYPGFHVVTVTSATQFTISEPWAPAQAGSGTWEIVPKMRYIQFEGRKMDINVPNYVAVSHTFGDASSTFIVVNGSQVGASWALGSGDIDPGFTTFNDIRFRLGYWDRLFQWHMRSTAKSLSEIRDYSKGRV